MMDKLSGTSGFIIILLILVVFNQSCSDQQTDSISMVQITTDAELAEYLRNLSDDTRSDYPYTGYGVSDRNLAFEKVPVPTSAQEPSISYSLTSPVSSPYQGAETTGISKFVYNHEYSGSRGR